MTNKLFIVKYVFVVNINENENINKNDAFSRNFDTRNDKRESFDEIIDFDIIVAQNICFFDVTSDIASKKNSIKLVDEIKKF